MFLGGLLIGLPVIMILLFINIGLGFVSRAAPTLNIFTLGFPALILGGFLIGLAIGLSAGRLTSTKWKYAIALEVVFMLAGTLLFTLGYR